MSDRAPHRSPEFIKFWVGQSVSLVGSEVSQLAMPLLAVLRLAPVRARWACCAR